MSNTRLTAYCFLAALTETESNLYEGVYIPVIKRTLSFYSLNGGLYGKDTDLQNLLLELYGINVPVVIIGKLLKAVERNMSRKEKGNTGFTTLENGRSFKIERFTFLEHEEKYNKGVRDANSIELAFEEYLKVQDLGYEVPPFIDFIVRNNRKLSAFFTNQQVINGNEYDKTFIHHVYFLENIEKNHHQLYKIAESLYVGSIVASIFESQIDFDAKFTNDECFYLDTQIVLKAFDLQSEFDTKPVNELVELIKDNGAKLKVLDITVEEIQYTLQNAINNYNSVNPFTSINEACIRRGISKSWLINFSGKLEECLSSDLNCEIEVIPSKLKEKFHQSFDIEDLKTIRRSQSSAEHDVFAYLFIREKRGGYIRNIQKAKKWFITANKNLLNFNISKLPIGYIPEVSLPDSLTAMLWLQNPNKNLQKIKHVGLSQLMASTLNEEIVSKELINEFDANVKRLDSITEEDYGILLSSLAYQSSRYIDKINNLMHEDKKEEFNVEAHKLLQKERERRNVELEKSLRSNELVSLTKSENEKLNSKLKLLEDEINQANSHGDYVKNSLEEISEKFIKYKKSVNKIIVYSVLLILLLLLIYVNYKYFNLIKIAKDILNALAGLGGLWSLFNLILNIFNTLKKKK